MKIEKINAWFALRGREMIQKRWWILAIFTLVFTIGFTGLKHFKVTASWQVLLSRRLSDACQNR